MKENNIQIFSKYLTFCTVYFILVSRSSSGLDYRYEACGPINCGNNGPNISFPFYIPGLQNSYCGYPGFQLNCTQLNGFPVLELPETDYVIEDIFYQTRSLRVINAAVLGSNDTGCVPRIRNTTLPTAQYDYAENITRLHLFSSCNNNNSALSSGRVVICGESGGDSWDLGLYEKNESFRNALENCGTNVVAPVEEEGGADEGKIGNGNLLEVLRNGFVMNWKASDCNVCARSGGRCGFNVTNYHFRCFCPDRPHSRSCKPEKSRSTVVVATAISGGGLLLLCLLISFIIWKCKKRFKITYILPRNKSSDPSTKPDVEGGSYYGIPVFCYAELEKATNNFDSSKELGDGGFGTVYYGKLRDGREVAIKRLYKHNCRIMEQFINEIKILTCLRHKNLVSLYGCTSRRSQELLLVYEYIPNGTVADHLHGERADKSPLTWAVRMNIAIETAAALAYLHKSDIIHRDVKTTNILLDSNCCVKVADFGLSRLFPTDVTHVSTAPQGTPGYVDPEYHQCYQLTDKSDVYSFGVVLIELISSMPAVDISRHRHEINLANLAVNRIQRRAFGEIVDASLGYGSDFGVTRMTSLVAELAFRCLQLEKEMRPSMDEVLDILKEIKGGDEMKLENKREDNGNNYVTGKYHSCSSPETDDVVLWKKKNFQSSPNAVTDFWVSSSSTTGSIG